MKRIIFLPLLCFSLLAVQAQSKYALENLESLSQEELDIYLNKALKLQKTGKIFTSVGGSMVAVGLMTAVTAGFTSNDLNGLGIMALGAVTTASGVGIVLIGIPVKVTGKKRVERISTIRNTAINNI